MIQFLGNFSCRIVVCVGRWERGDLLSNSPVLTQIITLLEVFAADLTGVGNLWGFVGALVYHQVVRLGETPLAILANELTLGAHLATEIRPAVIVVDSHYSKHFDRRYIFSALFSLLLLILCWLLLLLLLFLLLLLLPTCDSRTRALSG